ncbi:MAG: hypothetical protein ACWGMZ_03315 [Thermoguttaceae bacterium]
MNNKFPQKASFLLALALLLGFCWGCGTANYERRMAERLENLKMESKFNILSAPIHVPDTQVSVRVPQKSDFTKDYFAKLHTDGFENPPWTAGAMINNKPVEPGRLQPSFLDIPGLKLTFEGAIIDASGGKQPYYLYVGVVSDQKQAKYIPGQLQNALKEKFTDVSPFSDIQVQTPDGKEINWKRCHATGNQTFYYLQKDNVGRDIPLPGLFELFFHEEDDLLLILAWRLPAAIERNIDFQNWAERVAGGVKISP